MMNERLSVYVHIPFCIRKCRYCDFVSGPADEEVQKEYFYALFNEIELTGAESAGKNVCTVYIGGGTPTCVAPSYIEQTLCKLKENFNITDDAEISIEMNPGTADIGKIRSYVSCGVNRVSIGLQSADDGELKKLGRIHTYADFLKAYEDARNAGIHNINIDIMSSLPGQTPESYENTLVKVTELQPEHISAYSLIIEKGTEFGRLSEKELDLPDENEDTLIDALTGKILTESGYHRYEISNYALRGKECRHNLVYWDRGDYAGLGLGAASMINDIRYSNTDNLREYISGSGRIRKNVQILTKRECMEEFMFLGLRKTDGISRESFRKNFGADIYEIYGDVIRRQNKQGMLINEGDRLHFNDRGFEVSNILMSEYLFQ